MMHPHQHFHTLTYITQSDILNTDNISNKHMVHLKTCTKVQMLNAASAQDDYKLMQNYI